jgi:hypothetical protein
MQRVDGKSLVLDMLKEAFRSGMIAGLVMIPAGLLFFSLGLRVNEYGMKVIQTFFGALPAGVRFALFALLHFLISWGAAVPALLLLLMSHGKVPAPLIGSAYGAGFYLVTNSLALPWVFGDLTPWQLGFSTIYPSLILHVIYGLSVALTSREFIRRHAGGCGRRVRVAKSLP